MSVFVSFGTQKFDSKPTIITSRDERRRLVQAVRLRRLVVSTDYAGIFEID